MHVPMVRPEFIDECLKAGSIVPYEPFRLYLGNPLHTNTPNVDYAS